MIRSKSYDPYLNRLRFVAIAYDTNLVSIKEEMIIYNHYRGIMNRLQRINDSLYVKEYPPSLINYSINEVNLFSKLKGCFLGTKIEMNIPNSEYIAFDPSLNDTMFTFGEYPNSQLSPHERYREFRKIHTSNPDGSKFSAFYLYYNRFKIFNNSGEELHNIKIHDSLKENSDNENNRIIYRNSVQASNDYIYALTFNSTYEDIGNEPANSFGHHVEGLGLDR
ncbi:hypothetical protein [Rhodohalobacter sp.]|uniref:hypothetical protein n=1 Tax=Rhodohalobacter sp. TaxID=1974210 RepID=UPI002ACEEE1D|nr:hypothetical protein [Rhodohalobacter sp.]MDZ7757216.1 hypothetical protein [Rhodohalobacter sp.]